MGEVFAFLSGKGGTGKTSVCAGVATALAQSGRRVLCVDCDVGLRNLDISLGMSQCGALSFADVCGGGYSLAQAAQHPSYAGLSFLTAPVSTAQTVDKAGFQQMTRQAAEMFDYVLLDAPAGVGSGFQLVCAAAQRFLVVTGPGPAAVRDAARVGELLELMGKKDVRLIVNRVDRKLLGTVKATIDDVMDTAGLPLLGVVLEDSHVPLAAAFSRPLLLYSPRCASARALRNIANRLQGFPEPIGFR